MKSKKTFLIAALAVLVVSISVAGCGFYGVQGQSTAGFIKQTAIKKIKQGASKNYVFAKFGKPSIKYYITDSYAANDGIIGRVWEYCGNHKTDTTYLSLFHSNSVKNQCVKFTFDNNGKLVKTQVKTY
jgi:outer membrane protein assembly factor BamE (lipoprotein component of BamABCDE complex)